MLTEFLQSSRLEIIQSIFILLDLGLTVFIIWKGIQNRKIENLLQLQQSRREIWQPVLSKPELARIFEIEPDLKNHPVTFTERLFVKQQISHLYTIHKAAKLGQLNVPEGTDLDMANFFSLPIPKVVWKRIKEFQDRSFVELVEKLIERADKKSPSLPLNQQ